VGMISPLDLRSSWTKVYQFFAERGTKRCRSVFRF